MEYIISMVIVFSIVPILIYLFSLLLCIGKDTDEYNRIQKRKKDELNIRLRK